MEERGDAVSVQEPRFAGAQQSQLRLLAYVHLRNIHRSTGAGRTARQIVEHLERREDVECRVLADDADCRRTLPLVQEPWTRYRIHTFPEDTSRQQARWFLLDSPKAESFWPDAQVVFCTGESYVPVRRARLVVTAHDAGYFEVGAHLRDGAYWKQRMKWKLLFGKLGRRVDMVHTVSEFSAGRLAHYFPELRSRIRWVHNGVTTHFFEPVLPEGTLFVEASGLGSAPFVLVPGGLHFRKNAELILAASKALLEMFPELVIVVVNHSDPVYLSEAAKLGSRFRMLGFVSDPALRALYGAAQVVWFPSRYEGFGLPVVEAMACGVAVVASEASSIPEIAGGAARLADPADVEAHVGAVASLLETEGERLELAARGQRRAAEFTWTRCSATLKEHFDSLL